MAVLNLTVCWRHQPRRSLRATRVARYKFWGAKNIIRARQGSQMVLSFLFLPSESPVLYILAVLKRDFRRMGHMCFDRCLIRFKVCFPLTTKCCGIQTCLLADPNSYLGHLGDPPVTDLWGRVI